ncbi:MAG: DUF4386 domain-containing protein [Balneolaceae bacterium]|jgi:hypothetical protein
MGKSTTNISPLTYARIAGFLALLILIAGSFSGYIHSNLVVTSDAATTANNIIASEVLFRLGIVSSLAMYTIFIFYVLILHRLLKPVEENHALIMLVLALTGVPIAMLNQLNPSAVLLLLSDANYLNVFTPDQLHAQVMFFLRLQGYGSLIGVIFWGLWLFPLGWLVYQSGFYPKILGILLMIGCFGWLIVVLQRFLLPAYKFLEYSRYAAHLAELFWMLWLLTKGINVEKWKNHQG